MSDVIGFVLIFSLITTTIGLVYVTGFDGIQNAREVEERRNVERAFDILADNINDVVEGKAPARGTEIKVGDSKLSLGDQVKFTVNVTNNSGDVTGTEISASPIVYETPSGQQVLYMNGALIRGNVGGSSFISEPDFRVEHDSFIAPLIETRPAAGSSTGVSGGISLIRSRGTSESVIAYNDLTPQDDPPYSVTITVESPRTNLWSRYCDQNPDMSVDSVSGGTSVTCSLDNTVSTVYIQYKRVLVQFS